MSPQTAVEQRKAAVNAVLAIADAIKELKEVPSGTLYANLCGHLTLEQYNMAIDVLKSADVVKETGAHLLVWKGAPKSYPIADPKGI